MTPASAFAVAFFQLLSRLVDQGLPGLWSLPAKKLQLLAFQFICCNEEFLDFRTNLLG